METPAWLYKEMALGNISSKQLLESEKLAAGLTAGTTALMVGTALASPILAAAGAKGAEKMMDKIDEMTFDRDLKKVLDVNRDIGKPQDQQIRLAYQSIRTTNPKFSKDPLIAGTLLRQIMQNRVDPYDPKSPARVDLNIASQLQGSAGRGANDFVMQAAAESMGKLPSSLLQAHSDLENAAQQKADADRNYDLRVQQRQDALNRAGVDQKNKNKEYRLRRAQFAEQKRMNRTSAVFDTYGTGGKGHSNQRDAALRGIRDKARAGGYDKLAEYSGVRSRLLNMIKK